MRRFSRCSSLLIFTVIATTLGAGGGALSSGARAATVVGDSITLLGQLDLAPATTRNSDIWGWVDPATDKEYAILGEYPSGKVYIVDVSNPANPTLTSSFTGKGFDLKTWSHYLYLVDGNASGIDGQIFDIANPASPVFVSNFQSSHNIFIDDQGYMYLEFAGLKIYDLNPDPTAPVLVWQKFSFEGHDATVVGDMLYDFHGRDGTFIYDVTNRAAPVLLGSITDPAISYHHSGWVSADGNYVYINDELATDPSPDITVWDISVPATPVKVDQYQDSNATIHNTFRVGNFLFASYYVAGFRVFDISNPLSIQLVDEFDTSVFSGEFNFEGAWGCYPFAPSGNIYVSDEQNGLYVFSFSGTTPTGIPNEPVGYLALRQNFPNPFNPATTIPYTLTEGGPVSLVIYSASGERVRTLVDGTQSAGPQRATWNGRDDDGRQVASGVYFFRLRTSGVAETKRMVLLK